jgi:wobble nucleotide-excising tRNase
LINRLQLLRNVGQFDSVNGAANIPLSRLTLLYAENGRGKTTLAAILRSLASGDPLPIIERQRLTATHPPHVVLDCAGGAPTVIFQNNAWNRTLPNLVIFDDVFINQNVSSGLVVDSDHRQNLHEVILGTQGVSLNRSLQQLVEQIEEHNRVLRMKADAIPPSERGGMSVDDFCALQPRPNIDAEIQEAERNLAAAREQDTIRSTPLFDELTLPALNADELDTLLQRDLPNLEATAAAQVQAHLTSIGQDGEAWVADGMRRVAAMSQDITSQRCPFCAQDLRGSSVISHYRVYFSAAYTGLKQAVAQEYARINRFHGGEALAAFERAVRVCSERRQFWSRFCEVPEVSLDTAEIARAWRAAREAVMTVLQAKQSAPLEQMSLSAKDRAAITAFDAHRQSIAALNQQLHQTNEAIRIVKEHAASGNPTVLAADVARLKAVKARHTPEIATLCTEYLTEKAAKTETEQRREHTRADLDRYRQAVFPAYQTAINLYLQRFNAGFRLDSVTSVNTRAGSSCTYNIVINNTPIPVAGGSPAPGAPSFRNTLSAGDRSTLALAFFFASLDREPALAQKIVVIDDPITSLDEHRALTTAQEVRRVAERVAQAMVLSHNKPFLCCIWEGANRQQRTALEVVRDATGSTIRLWDVNQDCMTEHDRRHALLREYIRSNTSNRREVARSIRPTLEAFLRVAYPEHFSPGQLLGYFYDICRQRVGTPQQILDQDDTHELNDLIEYANKFHHDTNPAWETESINDTELLDFVRRTLAFARR